MENQTITIDGREIIYEAKYIDIFLVDYYFDNPRINYIISKYRPEQVNSQLIESALLSRDSTKELIHDIESNGGLLEPVIVLNNRVIEGNTRLCAYRRLYKRHQSNQWRYIKANIINDEVSTKEIFSILSNYHIRGKTPWDPYEKASCINKMIEQGYSIDEVVKAIGSTKSKVEIMLDAYKVMRDKYLVKVESANEQIIGAHDEIKKFSYFDALFTNKDLAERAKTTPQFIDEFVEWVAEGRIPKAQDVRELHNILNNKKSRKVFLQPDSDGSFEDAKRVLHYERPEKMSGFYSKLEQFRNILSQVNINKIQDEISDNPHMKNKIKACYKDFKRFCKDIGLDER